MAEKNDGAPDKTGDRTSIDAYVIKDPETFARNLARMIEEAGHAASAWIAPRETGEHTDTVAEPMADVVKTFSKVSEYWLADPQRAVEAQTRLFSAYMEVWSNSIRRMGDASLAEAVEPERGDRRFSDSDWKDNHFFSFLKQAYLVTSKWASDLVEHTEDLDDHTRHKATFYVKQLANAISPSNFMVSNPEIFKETIASNGANLVTGMRMLAEDIEAGHGDIRVRQVDGSKFKLGENIAVTPGKVIARNDLVEIIQYEPATEEVLKRPLLICPPWINKFYILDLNPEKSFVKWAVEQGHTVFVMSWINPDKRHASLDWNDYIDDGICFALDTIKKATGEKKVNAIGYCVGGTLLSAAICYYTTPSDAAARTASDLGVDLTDVKAEQKPTRPGDYLEFSPILTILIVVLAAGWFYETFKSGNPLITMSGLNTYNFVFLLVGALLHWRPRSFLVSFSQAMPSVAGVLLQFPFYGGIAYMLTRVKAEGASLSDTIAHWFVSLASDASVFSFIVGIYSAILGFFIPSAGGKWIIEAPYIMKAANEIGAHLGWTVMVYNIAETLPNFINPSGRDRTKS